MAKAPRLCSGYFTEEIIQTLRKDERAFLSQPCARCGKQVVTENKAGQWMPRTHSPARRHKSGKRSGKGGYKR